MQAGCLMANILTFLVFGVLVVVEANKQQVVMFGKEKLTLTNLTNDRRLTRTTFNLVHEHTTFFQTLVVVNYRRIA